MSDVKSTIQIPDGLTPNQVKKLVSDEQQRVRQEQLNAAYAAKLVAKREFLQADPFDPRTEVSADARKIVRNMWIIFVLLPVVFGILYAVMVSK